MKVQWIVINIAALQALSMNAVAFSQPVQLSFAGLQLRAQAAERRGDLLIAERLFADAVREAERFPENDIRLVRILEDLASCYEENAKPGLAAPLRERVVSIYEHRYGEDYPGLGDACVRAALCYRSEGKVTEAELFYDKALTCYERNFGQHYVRLAEILADLGQLFLLEGDYAKAETFYNRALAISSKETGAKELSHRIKSELCFILENQGKLAEAKERLKALMMEQ